MELPERYLKNPPKLENGKNILLKQNKTETSKQTNKYTSK